MPDDGAPPEVSACAKSLVPPAQDASSQSKLARRRAQACGCQCSPSVSTPGIRGRRPDRDLFFVSVEQHPPEKRGGRRAPRDGHAGRRTVHPSIRRVVRVQTFVATGHPSGGGRKRRAGEQVVELGRNVVLRWRDGQHLDRIGRAACGHARFLCESGGPERGKPRPGAHLTRSTTAARCRRTS